ncbi:MAG: helix-turn-helix transcriptional regulator [Ignavibacteria bacterium]|nr:helix-turn-helix transcriptional regulator [Ignavibacteria bacterium]
MLQFNFTRIFKARGIDKPFSFLVNSGYSANTATRIANNRVNRFDLADLEKICLLLNCTPNDILEWIPAKEDENNENHPFASLKRTGLEIQVLQVLNTLPINELTELLNAAAGKKQNSK